MTFLLENLVPQKVGLRFPQRALWQKLYQTSIIRSNTNLCTSQLITPPHENKNKNNYPPRAPTTCIYNPSTSTGYFSHHCCQPLNCRVRASLPRRRLCADWGSYPAVPHTVCPPYIMPPKETREKRVLACQRLGESSTTKRAFRETC